VVVSSPLWRQPRVRPQDDDLRAAAEVLNAGSRVTLLVGQGARRARAQVEAVADRLGAGVTTSLLGKPWVDERRATSAGVMGHLGTSASAFVLGGCDTLLIVGSNDPWTGVLPAAGAGAHRADRPRHPQPRQPPPRRGRAARRRRGDPRRAAPLLDERPDGGWRAEVEQAVTRWRTLAEQRAALPAEPLNPELVVRELSPRLPADAQVSVDVGSITYWYARQLVLPRTCPRTCRRRSRAWGRRCPTAWPPRRPRRTARWWRWPGTGRCR
jgi:pyruvate dehydrogenase (quinone)